MCRLSKWHDGVLDHAETSETTESATQPFSGEPGKIYRETVRKSFIECLQLLTDITPSCIISRDTINKLRNPKPFLIRARTQVS